MRRSALHLYECLFAEIGIAKHCYRLQPHHFNWAYSCLGSCWWNSVRFYTWYLPFCTSLHYRWITCTWRWNGSSPHGFLNMKISFALTFMSKKWSWNCSSHSRSISTINVCGIAIKLLIFNIWQIGKCTKHLNMIYDSNNVSCYWNDFTTV